MFPKDELYKIMGAILNIAAIILLMVYPWAIIHESSHALGCILAGNNIISISVYHPSRVECRIDGTDDFSKLIYYILPYLLNIVIIGYYSLKKINSLVYQLPLYVAYLNIFVNLLGGWIFNVGYSDIGVLLHIKSMFVIPYPGILSVVLVIVAATILYKKAISLQMRNIND